jgi:DnaJ-class molecular chaperone
MKESIFRKNFYELLGLCRDATELEIKIAYADLSRIYDPESRFFADIIEEPISEEQREVFDRITTAYNTLLDDAQRREYDLSLPAEE